MIKVRIKERNILELLEDAKKGDIIDLSTVTAIDQELINKVIEDAFKERLEKEVNSAKNETVLKVQDELNKYNKEIALLKKDNDDIKSITIKEEKSKYEIDKTNLENNFKVKEIELNNKINNLVNEVNEIKNKTVDSLNNEFNNKINLLKESHLIDLEKLKQINNQFALKEAEFNNKITLLNKEKEENNNLNKLNLEKELIKKESDLKIKFNEELADKDKEISKLINQRAVKNIKQTGEDLEAWCDSEIKNYMQNGLSNCIWNKDNTVVRNEEESKGSKADFIFDIYSDENKNILLTNICLEMKDENPDSVNRKKNEDHFKQLDKNRNKKECKYALLVSNLELDKPNDLPMYKVHEYPDMYVVRPAYLMTFINMIVSLSTKFKDLILNIEKEKIEFKSTTDILEEFEDLKRKYLDKPLETLEKELTGIKSASDSIMKSAEKINKHCDEITRKYIDEIESKLSKFNITKINKKINKVE